jgi:hypothetical protein
MGCVRRQGFEAGSVGAPGVRDGRFRLRVGDGLRFEPVERGEQRREQVGP